MPLTVLRKAIPIYFRSSTLFMGVDPVLGALKQTVAVL